MIPACPIINICADSFFGGVSEVRKGACTKSCMMIGWFPSHLTCFAALAAKSHVCDIMHVCVISVNAFLELFIWTFQHKQDHF